VSRTPDALAGTLLPLYFNADQKYQSQSSSGQVVAVMQAAKFGRSWDHAATCTAALGGYTTCRSLLIPCKMHSISVIVAEVFIQQAFQMPFIHHDHVVKEIPAAVANPTLGDTPFCHGLRKLVRFGWMPKLFTVSMTSSLKLAPRSKIR
jgi:hypothetical protein